MIRTKHLWKIHYFYCTPISNTSNIYDPRKWEKQEFTEYYVTSSLGGLGEFNEVKLGNYKKDIRIEIIDALYLGECKVIEY